MIQREEPAVSALPTCLARRLLVVAAAAMGEADWRRSSRGDRGTRDARGLVEAARGFTDGSVSPLPFIPRGFPAADKSTRKRPTPHARTRAQNK